MRDDKDAREMQRQILYLTEKYGARIRLLQAPLLEISSTVIRDRASRDLGVRYMVPDSVAEYIRTNHLYKKKEDEQYDRGITKNQQKTFKILKKDRYEHTLGVMYTSASLAMCYGADIRKAMTAGAAP